MKPLTYALKKEWHNLILLILPFLLIPFIGDQLPNRLATHWNFQGEPDGFTRSSLAMSIIPLVNVLLYLSMLYLPKIDPKNRIKIDQKPLPVLRTVFVVLFLGIHIWLISASLNLENQSLKWFYVGLGIFVLIMGNYLRTLKPNYFIGIRVPWALEDAQNWKKTHRMGSYTWVAGGILIIILFPFLDASRLSTIFALITVALCVIPAGYSFYYYKASQ